MRRVVAWGPCSEAFRPTPIGTSSPPRRHLTLQAPSRLQKFGERFLCCDMSDARIPLLLFGRSDGAPGGSNRRNFPAFFHRRGAAQPAIRARAGARHAGSALQVGPRGAEHGDIRATARHQPVATRDPTREFTTLDEYIPCWCLRASLTTRAFASLSAARYWEVFS